MKRVLTVICLVAVCFGVGYGAGYFWKQSHVKPLTILHVNDTHSHLEPVRSGELAGMGGVLERAAFVDSVRTADGADNVLLLHAGDFSQGTSYFSQFGDPLMVKVLNAMKYDVVTLGNHEFDNGVEALAASLAECEMPVVVCNYDFSSLPLAPYVKPYTIVEKAGRKIGVVGVLCSLGSMVKAEIANRLPELDMVSSVQAAVDEVRPQCDMVIALTHIGYSENPYEEIMDPQLCAATRGIDLFVGGHTHTYMSKPKFAKNLDGKRIPIVQSNWAGSYMGEYHWK